MYDEIPSLLYVAGALITVLSWTLFAFSKTIRPEGRRAFILCLSVIWILFFASSTLTLVPYHHGHRNHLHPFSSYGKWTQWTMCGSG